MGKDSIEFNSVNILTGTDLSGWSVVNGTKNVDKSIKLNAGGHAEYTVSNVGASQYCKAVIDVVGNITSDNNYNSKLAVTTKESYAQSDGTIYKKRNRCINISTKYASIYKSGERCKTSLVIEMKNSRVESMTIRIENNSTAEVTFKEVSLYRSIDVSGDQLVTNGTYIEARTDDPLNPTIGRIWLRTDL